MAHQRQNSREKIAITYSSQENAEPSENEESQIWTCLQCSFVNTSDASCTMCLANRPQWNLISGSVSEQPSQSILKPPITYGREARPSASQPMKRKGAKKKISTKAHRRMSTEEQISLAIQQAPQTEENTISPKYVPPSQVEELVQHIIENPDQYVSFEQVPDIFFNGDASHICSRLVGALNENKLEINKLRIQLNQERRLNKDLSYELEVNIEKCTNLERRLQEEEQEIHEVEKTRESDHRENGIRKHDLNVSNAGKRQMVAKEHGDMGHAKSNGDDDKHNPWVKDVENPECQIQKRTCDDQGEKVLAIDTVTEEIRASFEVIWNLLVEKVYHPEKYLPVEDVAVEQRDGKLVRHMYLTPMEIVMTEEICINREDFTIRFVDDNFPNLEIVNSVENQRSFQAAGVLFYKRNRSTGLKIPASLHLTQMFATDLHFLRMRATEKMARAMDSRDLKSCGVTGFLESTGPLRKISYGGMQELNDEVDGLRKEYFNLKQFTENMRVSKLLLVQNCSDEIERLRAIISSMEDKLRSV